MTLGPQSSRSSVVIQNTELLPLNSTPHTPGVDIQLARLALPGPPTFDTHIRANCNLNIGLLQSITVYPGERDTFKYERKDGCMTATCFLVQYTRLDLPTEIFTALVSGAIFTFGPPIKRTFTMFLVSSFNIFAILNCGESLGIILLSFFDNIGISATLAPIVLYVNWLFAGLLSTSLPRVLQIVSYILPSKYAMANVVPYAMDGLEFTCSEEQQQSTQCTIRNGKDVLDFYNFENNSGLNIMGLAVCVVVYRALRIW
ncbi:hypothetical protein BDV24DRAFT_159422 [Aspergillus arachidicola]|uniref:ABC-2 type transporter transmembrane domain-containing protein n=1 Tax=Aspergillus arachidicola TaxID=656916 RepID=A0A5N6YJJ5_9EURO|nr:hypothetical protein BDV24DRAFT_159422 [Aspergillus arachidicola]